VVGEVPARGYDLKRFIMSSTIAGGMPDFSGLRDSRCSGQSSQRKIQMLTVSAFMVRILMNLRKEILFMVMLILLFSPIAMAQHFEPSVYTDSARGALCNYPDGFTTNPSWLKSILKDKTSPEGGIFGTIKDMAEVFHLTKKEVSALIVRQAEACKKGDWSLDLCTTYQKVLIRSAGISDYCKDINPDSPICVMPIGVDYLLTDSSGHISP